MSKPIMPIGPGAFHYGGLLLDFTKPMILLLELLRVEDVYMYIGGSMALLASGCGFVNRYMSPVWI